MSVFQPDPASGLPTPSHLPAFQMVRRGYDPSQVDAYLPQLIARLEDAEQARAALQREIISLQQQTPPTFDQLGAEAAAVLQEAGRAGEQLVGQAKHRAEMIVAGAQEQAEQLRMDVTGKAQTVLAEAHEAAELLRREVEQEQAGLYAETRQVREFRDGLLEELGRVHGDISALLERTRKHKAKEPAAAGGTATPEVHPAPDISEEVSEPARAGDEAGEPRPMQAPTGRRGQQDAALSSATERHPGHLSTSARQKARRPGPAEQPLGRAPQAPTGQVPDGP